MKLLLHTCCGPCSIYPLSELRQEFDISAFFFNPNIHPFQEFQRRQDTFITFCKAENLPIVESATYGLSNFLRKVVFHEQDRCKICYSWRMEETAKKASLMGFDAFSTTLLYSRYQNHEELRACGIELSATYGIDFIYRDFREGWQYGIDKSKEHGMYRQPYCGCVYSEQDRYDKKSLKKDSKQ